MTIEINHNQAKALLEYFGGEPAEVTVQYLKDGHSGPGLYCWCSDYPEDGCQLLDVKKGTE